MNMRHKFTISNGLSVIIMDFISPTRIVWNWFVVCIRTLFSIVIAISNTVAKYSMGETLSKVLLIFSIF